MTVFRALSAQERMLFLAGLLLKLVLGTLLASSFVTELFLPFLKEFVGSGFENPYRLALARGQADAFPYPAVMLVALSLPQIPFGGGGAEISHLELLAFRLPLLLADLGVFWVLLKWLPGVPARRLIWLYWLSPVLIYITYIHGQLDVIPIALLLGSLYLLFRDRLLWAGVLVGLSLAAKTNVALIYPFYFLYLIARGAPARSGALFLAVSAGTFALVNAPLLTDPAFIRMVFMNAQQAKVFSSFILLNEAQFYVVPAGWLLLMALGARAGLQNRDVFIMFTGFTFCVVLLLIPPQHGWYYWIMPFFVFYFAKEERSSVLPFATMQLLYLVYFLVSPKSDYLQVLQTMLRFPPELGSTYAYLERAGLDAEAVRNLVFTFLQCALMLICVQVYSRGLARYGKHKLTGTPFLIGIGGNSGVGKSTLSDSLGEIFTPRNVTVLRGDDQHRWQRGHEKWQEFTHLNPKANRLHSEIDMLRKLASGRRIYRRHYDHSTGRFTSEIAVAPNRLILLEGLHPFFLEAQRRLFDLKIFVAPEESLAIHWKICRDKSKRDYTTEEVMAQIEKRRADAERYIASQGAFADILLRAIPRRPIADIGEPGERVELDYEITVPNSLDIEPAVEMVASATGVEISHGYPSIDHQLIRVSGSVTEEEVRRLAAYFDDRLQEIGALDSRWPPMLYGVVLFLLVWCIFERADYGRD